MLKCPHYVKKTIFSDVSLLNKHDCFFQVGWVRADTKAILTLYDTIITHDPRIKLSGDFTTSFNLHIANVQEEDRGDYMCQINTRDHP